MISASFTILFKFAICAAIIFYAGRRVAKYGDIIAEKTGLGGLWIGFVLISITTSIPEIFTGVGSSLFIGKPDISMGNVFGANSYNLLNVILLDALNKNTPLLSIVSKGQLIIAVLSILPLSLAIAGVFFASHGVTFSIMNVSVWSILIFCSYLMCAKLIFDYETVNKTSDKNEEDTSKYQDSDSMGKTLLNFIFFAAVIAAAGIWLSYIADEISAVYGFNLSFVGGLFLGFATTLPEISVSIAALRLGAKEMAVANMLGSNLFNLNIIFLNDILYRKGDIFTIISPNAQASALTVLILTSIIVISIVFKPQKKLNKLLSIYSIPVIVVFLIGAWLNFILK